MAVIGNKPSIEEEIGPDELVAVPKHRLNAIGDAIRLRRDTTKTIQLADMPLEIELIEGGGLKVDCGAFMVAKSVTPSRYPIEHRLGNVPRMWAVWTDDTLPTSTLLQGHIGGLTIFAGENFSSAAGMDCYCVTAYHSNTAGAITRTTISQANMDNNVLPYVTDTSIVAPHVNTNSKYYPNVLYKWVAVYWDDEEEGV